MSENNKLKTTKDSDNQNVKAKKKSFFTERRFVIGSISIGLTAAFVTLVIILNVVFYTLAYSYGWYIDLSSEQYYGITDKSIKALDEVLTEDTQIKIIFCRAKDRVIDDPSGYYVYKCIETYRKQYPDNIKVEYLDVNANPDLANIYMSQLNGSLYTNNVIIESNKTTSIRVLTFNSFFTFDSDSGAVFAFNGEMRLTSNIIGLVTSSPLCYFTVGHGESLYDSNGYYNALYEMMLDAGFIVKEIDLTRDNIDDSAKVIIINDPVYDFKGGDADVNEMFKLSRFMSDQDGNMMIFLSPENQAGLKNLRNWLEEWGISIKSGQVNDKSNSLTSDGTTLVASYPTGTDFAASLHSGLRGLDSTPYTIVKNAIAIESLWSSKGRVEVGTVLYSSASSVLSTVSGENYNGSHSIMALVRQTKIISEINVRNYLLVTSSGYADGRYINSNAYGNRDIIFSLATQMGRTTVPTDIDFKIFSSEALVITTASAYAWTITLAGVIPTLLCGAGVFVNARRKRK